MGLYWTISWKRNWNGYYENGQLNQVGNFVDGKGEGIFKMYHDNGQLSEEGNVKNDNWDGLWVGFYNDGKLEYEGNYKDGK